MKVFIYSSFNEKFYNEFKNEKLTTIQFVFRDKMRIDQARLAFEECDVLMGNPPPEWFENIPPKLKFWQIDSAGFNQYKGLKVPFPVANMGDFFAQACAETMLAGILAYYRGMDKLIKLQQKKKWEGLQLRRTLHCLGDKKVLILGSGTIGLAIRKMLKGFGAEVKLSARRSPIADIHDFSDVLKVLSDTDLVINTLPGTAEQYVSKEFFESMKKGSVYANVGRGNTTNEEELIKNLQSKKLGGAIIDVTNQEPLPKDNPLWDMENVILTQHTGGGSIDEDQGKIGRFLRNLDRFMNKKPIEDLVDLTMGY